MQEKEMDRPNIIMFHRVKFTNKQNINNWYFRRRMIIEIEKLYKLIDKYLSRGYKMGSIEQCLENNNYFHLSFDDGFKEHLEVAFLLKKRYNFNYSSISFSINIANSVNHDFTGMDLAYSILENKQIEKLNHFLKTNFKTKDIAEIKNKIASLTPKQLKRLSDYFSEFQRQLKNTFLSKSDIIELSKIAKITSHGITHRFLTYHKKESEKEILESKAILEHIINKKIDTFCYPEGKNDFEIQFFCKKAGYKYSLSIRHEENNKFCIGRKIM
jgi:hypothetical protein